METPKRAQCHFSKGLLLSASVLALWIPQGTWAALRIQKIPEHPQKDENLLLSVQGIPGAFQDFNWYLGEETNGGTMLFTYFPDLQRPQRDGSAMGQRDIVGFPNGSMLLHRVQPTDSGTYQVAITINPEWTMRAKTEVRVAEKLKELPITQLPVSAGIMAAILIGSLASGSLFIGCVAHLLLTRGWRGQSHRYRGPRPLSPSLCPLPHPLAWACGLRVSQLLPPLSSASGDQNIYEVMPSPTFPVSLPGDTGSMSTSMVIPPPLAPSTLSHTWGTRLSPRGAPYFKTTRKRDWKDTT
uniref:CEA cell adhesion molecule 19 n=1 Tax=Ursus maritimus TaxID=29073 RepID=A0A452VEV4_URSMA